MRHKLLRKLAELTVNKTWLSLAAIFVITIIFSLLASTLEMNPGFTDMLPEDSSIGIEYENIIDEFDNALNIIVLVEGQEQNIKDFSDYISPRLLELDDWVARVDYKLPSEFLKRNGLKLLNESELENYTEMFTNPNLIPFLKNLNDSFEKEYRGDDSINSNKKETSAVRFLDGIEEFVNIQTKVFNDGRNAQFGKQAVDAITIGDTYMVSPDKQMLLMMVEPAFNILEDMYLVVDAVNGIEELVKTESNKFNVSAGLTGSITLQRDEMHAMEEDSFTITVIALIGILILFIVSFRMWVSPILSILTIILGVIWAIGFASLLIEYLSMMTAMMGIILVGLGIDFSVHIISVYTEKRNSGFPVLESMIETLQKVGPGIITGGITTGSAFLTMMISDNRGMYEFGLVAGCGIIITMLATIFILPTFLVVRERVTKKFDKLIQPKDVSYRFLGIIAEKFSARYLFSFIGLLILSILLFYRASTIEIDYNYLNMEPEGLESILLQDKMIDAFDMSTDYVLFTLDNLDEMRKVTDAAKEMKTGGGVESITDYLPNEETEAQRFHFILNLRRKLNSAQVEKKLTPEQAEQYIIEMERLEFNIIELQDMACIGGQDKIYDKAIYLVGEADDTTYTGKLTSLLASIYNKDILLPLTYFQQQFAGEFKASLLEMANTEPLTLENLPNEIRNRFVGNSGEMFLVTVYPKKNIWEDVNFLYVFADEAKEVSEKATGFPLIFIELMDVFTKDGVRATLLAILAVFLVLWLDFRSIKFALLGMTPLVVGVIWMVGSMELFGQMLTMVNIMAIPLIIGIGIDDGVHILHRYKIEKNLYEVYRSTGKAVLLTSLTTMLGFGSLWFATYRGLGSMGIALFIGVGTCFLATLFVIPVILGWSRK